MSTLKIIKNDSESLVFERSRTKEVIQTLFVMVFLSVYYSMLFTHSEKVLTSATEDYQSTIVIIIIVLAPLVFLVRVLKSSILTLYSGDSWSFDVTNSKIDRNGTRLSDFKDIKELSVKYHPGSDAPDTYVFKLIKYNGSTIDFEEVTNIEQAREFSAAIGSVLNIQVVKHRW